MDTRFMLMLTALLTALLMGSGFSMAVGGERVGCDQIEWPDPVLKGFPDAEKACRKVIVRNGVRYAQFTAKFVRVDADGKVFVTVMMPDGSRPARGFTAPRDLHVLSHSGKTTFDFQELEKGDLLDVFIAETRWSVKGESVKGEAKSVAAAGSTVAAERG